MHPPCTPPCCAPQVASLRLLAAKLLVLVIYALVGARDMASLLGSQLHSLAFK